MRILLVAIFGLILAACGEKSEGIVIHEVLIGGSIENVRGLGDYERSSECEIITYYKKSPLSGIDSITIFEMGGIVEGMSLNISDGKFDSYISDISDILGAPIEIKSHDDDRYYKYKGRGEVFKAVVVKEKPWDHAVYSTKKLDSSIERIQKECYQ